MATSSSPITQASATQYRPNAIESTIGSGNLFMDLRGVQFEISRDELMSLPESVLLCLFPNGMMLDAALHGAAEQGEMVHVDFDPECLRYILDFFHATAQQPAGSSLLSLPSLQGKPAIIVLREDLDFYVIPPTSAPVPQEEMFALKRACAAHLLEQNSIFAGLKMKATSQGVSAEQHLIDMLCSSGFGQDDDWGHRALEPRKACISSVALADLKDQSGAVGATPGGIVTSTAQKLLLFWRKPARKCWWDGLELEGVEGVKYGRVKVWIRRVWTLELSVLGVK
ncbi:hypothetical protein SAICODRAFT_27644 [Saitoella complicata NRRL Y-17804]|nr:uncharacterized protein SAICODRAFT_27644 [Saitoella complicata NRRL Y-17804]ODQ50438.1 hypothetical protein SAICODRAFT_27644 [Saitoella complicata NRRL Y-17804]